MIIWDIMLKKDTIQKNHPNSNLVHSDLKSKQSYLIRTLMQKVENSRIFLKTNYI